MSRTHNELSEVIVTAIALTASGVAFTPTTARYRVDDCRSSKQLVAWTALTPSTAMQITIPPTANAIVNNALNTPEVKTVTVEVDKDLATQFFGAYNYRIRNLNFAQVA